MQENFIPELPPELLVTHILPNLELKDVITLLRLDHEHNQYLKSNMFWLERYKLYFQENPTEAELEDIPEGFIYAEFKKKFDSLIRSQNLSKFQIRVFCAIVENKIDLLKSLISSYKNKVLNRGLNKSCKIIDEFLKKKNQAKIKHEAKLKKLEKTLLVLRSKCEFEKISKQTRAIETEKLKYDKLSRDLNNKQIAATKVAQECQKSVKQEVIKVLTYDYGEHFQTPGYIAAIRGNYEVLDWLVNEYDISTIMILNSYVYSNLSGQGIYCLPSVNDQSIICNQQILKFILEKSHADLHWNSKQQDLRALFCMSIIAKQYSSARIILEYVTDFDLDMLIMLVKPGFMSHETIELIKLMHNNTSVMDESKIAEVLLVSAVKGSSVELIDYLVETTKENLEYVHLHNYQLFSSNVEPMIRLAQHLPEWRLQIAIGTLIYGSINNFDLIMAKFPDLQLTQEYLDGALLVAVEDNNHHNIRHLVKNLNANLEFAFNNSQKFKDRDFTTTLKIAKHNGDDLGLSDEMQSVLLELYWNPIIEQNTLSYFTLQDEIRLYKQSAINLLIVLKQIENLPLEIIQAYIQEQRPYNEIFISQLDRFYNILLNGVLSPESEVLLSNLIESAELAKLTNSSLIKLIDCNIYLDQQDASIELTQANEAAKYLILRKVDLAEVVAMIDLRDQVDLLLETRKQIISPDEDAAIKSRLKRDDNPKQPMLEDEVLCVRACTEDLGSSVVYRDM